MKYKSPFHKIVSRDKGLFEAKNFLVSTDSIHWIHSYTLTITEQGQLYSSDENDSHYLLLQSLQSCYVQIHPTLSSGNIPPKQQYLNQQQARRLIPKKASGNLAVDRNSIITPGSNAATNEEPPVIFIKTYENDKLYIRVPSKSNFGSLISCLTVWQNLKPQGLVKKWYCENKVEYSTSATTEPHELLVCRFKIYGPIPSKYTRNFSLVKGPKAPIYQPKVELATSDYVHTSETSNGASNGHPPGLAGSDLNNNIQEGWFFVIGALKSNGMLNFISELDGTLLYTIDIKQIMSSEIRQMHHSIFDNSNVLFIGQLKELRYNNVIKTTTTLTSEQLIAPFLTRDGKQVPCNQRILIEFPLHIDLEDWFVGLNYFGKREYIGSYCFQPNQPVPPHLTHQPIDIAHPPHISSFTRDNFRVSKKIAIDIIEAKFDNFPQQDPDSGPVGKIYAEVRMWGYPWSRTAIVAHTNNPFWKEEFSTDLPISTQMIHILIKKCSFNDSSYSAGDKLIGTVYITPDILTKQVKNSTTVMAGSSAGNGIQVNGFATGPVANSDSSNTLAFYNNNEIVRLAIYDSSNLPIGKLLLNVNLKEQHILPPSHFKSLESMLGNAPMKDLIQYCNENVPSSDFEDVSLMLLDIFQSLGVEDSWFKALMEAELVNVDILTRKNYYNSKRLTEHKVVVNSTATSATNNAFNTLFRGSSIFSKSLEKYNLRIGQEYLEKALGDFFLKISTEKKSCEVDPRYVEQQERAQRRGKSLNDSEDSDDDESIYDESTAKDRHELVQQMVEENFQNLYNYAEEVWDKIYSTSNDLPVQIKIQLKNFRTKVELACDPDDKTTALNCLSAFIFLRFFCPAILNPKLFYLTKNHQTGSSQRTLTLIAKILLNLANRQEFSIHKEPHLIRMNSFLRKHQHEIYDYFDKITGRKNDFNEKILNLSHDVKRFDLGLGNDSTSNELPTTPYLIDKYLRLTELIHLLDYNRTQKPPISAMASPSSNFGSNGGAASDSSIKTSQSVANINALANFQFDPVRDNSGVIVSDGKDVYQIGSLEFEKSEFLDLVGDNETEGFIKSLCRSNENIFSFITSNITLKDLQKQSTKIMTKIHDLETLLENFEFPNNLLPNQNKQNKHDMLTNSENEDLLLWESFTNDILARCYLDVSKNCLVYLDKDLPLNNNYRKVVEHNALGNLKLKFSEQTNSSHVRQDSRATQASISTSFSSHSLGSVLTGKKNSFKRWLRK
ncbi:GTPase-activating protein [Scheffersomyces xylosifermentans]|uniref:GTPase-activating protein n=1 Tax=Scheffersomyces xylosifermentans TaxID=1304137 RepID=UPI00315CBDA7